MSKQQLLSVGDLSQSLMGGCSDTLDTIKSVKKDLVSIFKQLSDQQFSESTIATEFVLGWLESRIRFLYDLDSVIQREIRPHVADDFTSAIAFTLDAFLTSRGYKKFVHSEVKILKKSKGKVAIQPDVTVFLQDKQKPMACIECKIQVGWGRDKWKGQQDKRENRLREEFPEALYFLVVCTSQNWDANSREFVEGVKLGKYYCLTDSITSELNLTAEFPNMMPGRISKLEPMFLSILEKVRKDSQTLLD